MENAALARKPELTLSFPASAHAAVAAHPRLVGDGRPAVEKACASTYFDTAKFALRGAGLSLCTRTRGGRNRQVLSLSTPATAGLTAAPEWTDEFTGGFDFSAIPDEALRHLLNKEAKRLQPLFTVHTRRETRLLAPAPGVRIALTIASGRIVAGERESPICELVLALREGQSADLWSLAAELAGELPLLPLDLDQAERGYRLLREEPLRPQKTGRLPLATPLPPADAFIALARLALRSWQSNLHGALTAADPEFVHQLRVALRRLDTLIKVFKPALPARFPATWIRALKEVAAATGEVRDLDVMRDAILLPAAKGAATPAAAAAISRALAACEAARRSADTSLERLADGVPLLALARDLEGLAGRKAKRRLTAFAEKRLAKLHGRAVQRLSEVVADPTPCRAHRLRIALKHLRYGSEFFATLFDEAAMQAFAKDVAGLQDELGFLNDFHVALARLTRWSAHEPALVESRDCLAAWYAPRIGEQFAGALRQTADVLGECLPWCGECERRGLESMHKKLRRGITPRLA